MPHTGDRTITRFTTRRMNRRAMSLIAVLLSSMFMLACAGVSDNGTTFETLATIEARQAPAAPPTPDPSGGPPDPAALAAVGRDIYGSAGCIGCHTIDGSASAGPTWAGLWMSNVPLDDGSTVVADEDYIHTAIVDPGAQIHQGFPNIMPSYAGQFSDEQIDAIIEFIKTLE